MTDTVLPTGTTGFIANRIALDRLDAGYAVRGSLRTASRADGVRAALRRRLRRPGSLDRPSFVDLDLGRDAGGPGAMEGIAAVGADRVRPTSSAVAAMHEAAPQGAVPAEAERTASGDATTGPCERSKTLGERAAWDFATAHPGMRLTAITPGLVLGAPRDRHFGTLPAIVARLLRGRDPASPNLGLPVVDVADMAAMHPRALDRPETAGKRSMAADRGVNLRQMARVLARALPDRRNVTRVAPGWLLRIVALADPAVRGILARAEMRIDFAPWEEALRRAAVFILDARG